MKTLPNGINLNKLRELLMYSNKYEISIQFWPDQIAVYISKDGVHLNDFGGDFDFAVDKSLEYLDKITGNNRFIYNNLPDAIPVDVPSFEEWLNKYFFQVKTQELYRDKQKQKLYTLETLINKYKKAYNLEK